MRSTVPSSAVAMRRTSSTSQSAPTPRQSHWNRPAARRRWPRTAPRASRAGSRRRSAGWRASGWRRARRRRPARPASARCPSPCRRRRGSGTRRALAAAGWLSSIRTMPARGPPRGRPAGPRGCRRSRRTTCRPGSGRAPPWPPSAAAAILSVPIEPEVSTMMISAASPSPELPGLTGAGAGDRDDGVHVGAAVGQELVLVDVGGELGHRAGLPLGRRSVRRRSGGVGGSAVGGVEAGERDGDVVVAALGVGPVDQRTGERDRLAPALPRSLPDQVAPRSAASEQ